MFKAQSPRAYQRAPQDYWKELRGRERLDNPCHYTACPEGSPSPLAMERGTEREIRTASPVLPQEYFIPYGTFVLCSISCLFDPFGFWHSSLVWQVYEWRLKAQNRAFKPTKKFIRSLSPTISLVCPKYLSQETPT